MKRGIRLTCDGVVLLDFTDLPRTADKMNQLSGIIAALRDLGFQGHYDTELVDIDEAPRIDADGVWLADPEPGGPTLPTREDMFAFAGLGKPAFQYFHEPNGENGEQQG